MASVQVEPNHGAGSHPHSHRDPHWKLYHNPHYSPRDGRLSPARSCESGSPWSPMIVVLDDGSGGEEVEVEAEHGYGAMSSELELCVERIRELRAELEFERRMRRKAEAMGEALAAELAEERRRGEAAEAECRALREEAGAARAELGRALDEVEEERRMLRVAELWREERVQMKLADARAAMEEKLREVDDALAAAAAAELHASAVSVNRSSCGSSSPVGKSSPTRSLHGHQSPSRSQHGHLHRREAAGGENPHIRRGIKGFVEFPRAVRVRPREERVDLVSNLECQRAQLRVLMRHRSPAAGMGLVGAAENLVV
ncbi:hypothetical protein ACP4OV_002943 [Aristida adscensionis]